MSRRDFRDLHGLYRERERGYAGLARSVGSHDCYVLTVVVTDVGEAVRAVGGWIVDRVRAGWRVGALVPFDCDVAPLHILGVTTIVRNVRTPEPSVVLDPAALAIGADAASAEHRLPPAVRERLHDPGTEVTLWGDDQAPPLRRFDEVQHRLSPAARAFKATALCAAGAARAMTGVEVLRSSGAWYPLDRGVDLERIATTN